MAPWCQNMYELVYVINGVSRNALLGWYIEMNMKGMHSIKFTFVHLRRLYKEFYENKIK